MPATVDIIIKGIAICYRKDNLWKILFPTNNCHTIKFTTKKGDNEESEPKALSKSTGLIEITAPNATEPEYFETNNFNAHVFDLTSTSLGTHPRIRRKTAPGKFVLMTISKACFSVNKYLNDFTTPLPELKDNHNNSTSLDGVFIAHSIKATITGGPVIVRSSVLGTPFTTDNDGIWTLIFDNDCEEIKQGKNDMDMFYEIIEEDDTVPGSVQGRQFQIGNDALFGNLSELFEEIKKESTVQTLTEEDIKKIVIQIVKKLGEPPSYVVGKPCLSVKVTDPKSIETLP